MSKAHARALVYSMKCPTWEELLALLVRVHPVIARDPDRPSRVNKTFSVAATFNIYFRMAAAQKGKVEDWNRPAATNILRDFGDPPPSKHDVSKVKPHIHTEPLMPLPKGDQ
jgi:hypothetical protein